MNDGDEKSQKIKLITCGGLVLAAIFVCAAFFLTQDIETLRDIVRDILETARSTPWSFPLVLGLYVLSSAVMFPIIVLNLATAMVFGPVYGFLYALAGSLLSCTVFFFVGRFGRRKGLKQLFAGPKMSRIDAKLRDAGVIGIAALRLIPMAPFGVFNMAAGITSVTYLDYIAGTALAFLPGGFARALVGDSLVDLFLNPSAKSMIYLAIGIVLWIAVVIGLQRLLKKYRTV